MKISRATLLKILIALISTVFCLVILEVGFRLVSRRDEDGTYWFRSARLKPFHVPVNQVRHEFERYRGANDSTLIYDPDLGWNQRPNVAHHNDAGFVSIEPHVELAPPADRLRIALFGDSFTQGSFEAGWWRALETGMNALGDKAEVLNFAVGGYGIDQAFLRWQKDGAKYRPHIVILGFLADDCLRDVNLLRLMRDPTSGIALMKPRFVLEGDGLRLINSPTPPPERVPEILADFERWPLSRHEWFFSTADYQQRWWRRSRAGAVIEEKATPVPKHPSNPELFRLDGEMAQLAQRILRKMHREVEAGGGSFYVLHLPRPADIALLRTRGELPYRDLLASLKSEHSVIQPEEMMRVSSEKDPDAFPRDGHYGANLNAALGRFVAQELHARRKIAP